MIRRERMAPLLLLATAGCFDEDLAIFDLEGTIVLSREAATQTITVPVDDNGDPILEPGVQASSFAEKVVPPDPRFIGPVYVGLYPEVVYDFRDFPHPAIGPDIGGAADSYPYGGTTVGDFRFACMAYFNCKMVSGRFTDFDDIVDWFNNVLVDPITDASGDVVQTGEFIRQTCFDILEVTADDEVRITATEDRNGDGEIDHLDLDFVENSDGDFVAHFKILQADYYDGMTAWAYMDAPRGRSYEFSTCNPSEGQRDTTYDQDITSGQAWPEALNKPYAYLEVEDWVSSKGFVWNSPYESAEIVIDFNVGSGNIDELRSLAQEEAE